MYQVNNLVIFSGKPIGSEEFLNQMVEALGITKDRHPKGRPRKMENKTIEKIGHVSILISSCIFLNDCIRSDRQFSKH